MPQASTSATIRSKQIISVKEARKLLGKDAKHMSDDHIEDMISLLSSIADNFLQENGSKVY